MTEGAGPIVKMALFALKTALYWGNDFTADETRDFAQLFLKEKRDTEISFNCFSRKLKMALFVSKTLLTAQMSVLMVFCGPHLLFAFHFVSL